ncbi:hypothetical protein QTP88_024189 [Uroleucon formosanum]
MKNIVRQAYLFLYGLYIRTYTRTRLLGARNNSAHTYAYHRTKLDLVGFTSGGSSCTRFCHNIIWRAYTREAATYDDAADCDDDGICGGGRSRTQQPQRYYNIVGETRVIRPSHLSPRHYCQARVFHHHHHHHHHHLAIVVVVVVAAVFSSSSHQHVRETRDFLVSITRVKKTCVVMGASFSLLKSLRIETILSVTSKTQLEFGSALLYFEISQQMSTYK